MYVIFPAVDVVEESYFSLVAQENETPGPTGLRSSQDTPAHPITQPGPTYHDTRPEQDRAEAEIARQISADEPVIPRLTQLQPGSDARPSDSLYSPPALEPALPDLVPAYQGSSVKGQRSAQANRTPDVSRQYSGKVDHILPMASSNAGHLDPQMGGGSGGAAGLASIAPARTLAIPIRDLIHPSLCEPLKNQQQITFRLVKSVSDFTHSLSKLHEQHAEDLHSLVDEFRGKNTDIRPNCNNSLFTAWETLLNETETTAQANIDISGVLGRSVSRPLLEKTFHMKIQSRNVFLHRESFETILDKTEKMLLKCHDEYCMAFDIHTQQNDEDSATALTEAHNNYIQQLHAANGMVDQYYRETLPQLLQELDDVYHDVSAVVAETVVQGADIIALKSGETSRRYENIGRICKQINPPQDLNAFIKILNIPETLTVSKHIFTPPQPMDPAQIENAPTLRDEIIVDRATQNSARNRFDILKKEAMDLDVQNRQLAEALDTLIRMQARSLESQLFNKANELQEDISMKRFDQRVAHIHLGAIRAQKEMFATKVDGAGSGTTMGGGGGGLAGMTGVIEMNNRQRKLSAGSGGDSAAGGSGGPGGAGMKNKWVNAFKSIKGNKEPTDERISKNGKDIETTPPAVIENSHIFQEYTYKKITPCDICSQILRGHTRQGLKCKLCRMNVHPDCQDGVPKCQPKSRLLRRQKSASEIDSRMMGAEQDDTHFSIDAELMPASMAGSDRRSKYLSVKSMSIESQMSSASSGSNAQGQKQIFYNAAGRPVGGSYSDKTGLGDHFKLIHEDHAPKLAQVARALMAAKTAGQLPSALKKVQDEMNPPKPAEPPQQGQNGQNGQNGQAAKPR